MSEFDLKYKTKFQIKAKVLNPSEDLIHETKASLKNLDSLFPKDIDPETDPDILYIAGNLAIGGVLNLNDDGLSIEETISVYKKFEKKQTNLEHDRNRIVGFIVKAGLSELGTDKLITEEEAKSKNAPFNIAVVIAIWKVAPEAKDLCKFLVDNANEDGNQELSLSFEVGFDQYQIIELSGDSSDFIDAKKIIYPGAPEYNSYDLSLKINGGSGKKNGNRIGRALCGRVLPLGAGIVTMPAAKVKGLLPIEESPKEIKANPFSPPTNQPFDVPAMKIIKLSKQKKKEFHAKYPDIEVHNNKHVEVVLKDGKKVKLANYDRGYLEMPADSEFEEADIISLHPSETADITQVDNSPIIHPRINEEYPNVNTQTQELEKLHKKQREELRNKEYKDASGSFIELINKLQKTAERYFSQNNLKNGVLKSTTHNNMNIEQLNEIKAKVASTEDMSYLKEAIANVTLFAEEIAKKSEELEAAAAKHKKDAEDSAKHKMEAEKMHESVKHEMEALKNKLKEMEDCHMAAEKERKFNARMTKLEADYDMDVESRKHVASDIGNMSDEDYANYEMKLSALMKEKSKTYKNDLAKKLASSLQADKKDQDEMEAKKKEAEEKKKSEEAEAAIKLALASATAHPTDPAMDIIGNMEFKSLKDILKASISKDVLVGGETVGDLETKRKKKLES